MATGIPRGIVIARLRSDATGLWRLSRRILGRDWPVAYLFAAPLLIMLFGLIGRPLYNAVYLSLFEPFGTDFVGLNNYANAWRNPLYRNVLSITARFVMLSLLGQAILGTAAALLIAQGRRRWRGLLAGALLLPWALPEVVTALAWRWFYDPILGPLPRTMLALGIPLPERPIVMLDEHLALYSLSLVNIWRGMPFFALVLLAGLQAIDAALYDAASVDGANAWQRFRYVTLPGLRVVLVVAALLSILFSLNSFTIVRVMTNGGPLNKTLIFPIYLTASSRSYQELIAQALGIAPFLLLLIATLGVIVRSGDGLPSRPRNPVAQALAALARPFVLLLRFPLLLLDAVADEIARALGAAGARLAPRTFAGWLWRERLRVLGFAALLAPFLLFAFIPIYLMAVSAFKTNAQINTFSDPLWPMPWSTQQIRLVFERTEFALWFRNSLAVGAATTAITMTAATLGAYALARLRWRGGNLVATAILGTALVPSAIFLFPLYLLLARLELINTPWALVVAYPSLQLPMACWLLLGFFRAIPEDLEEAALLDGCSHLGAFLRVALPLSWPGLVAVGLFTFVLAWNELMFAGFFLRSEVNWTLPMGLALVSSDIFPYGQIFAMSFLMALPVTVCAAIGQRAMIAGLTEGAVKG